MFRPLVPHTKLNQQSTSGSLEVKAALEHSGLCGGSFGWQINNHQTLKLLEELLRHRVACSLGLLPRHLEPVERLIHLHHLLMESARAYYACAQVLNTDKTRQHGLMLTDDANMRNIQYSAFLYDMWNRHALWSVYGSYVSACLKHCAPVEAKMQGELCEDEVFS